MADLTGLNEKIASWFEPKPALPDDVYLYLVDEVHDVGTAGVWKFIILFDSEDRPEIIPIDFLHDEDANARLLEAMPLVGLEHGNQGMWHCGYGSPINDSAGDALHADRKTAIALAFCKWAGIPVEEEL